MISKVALSSKYIMHTHFNIDKKTQNFTNVCLQISFLNGNYYLLAELQSVRLDLLSFGKHKKRVKLQDDWHLVKIPGYLLSITLRGVMIIPNILFGQLNPFTVYLMLLTWCFSWSKLYPQSGEYSMKQKKMQNFFKEKMPFLICQLNLFKWY